MIKLRKTYVCIAVLLLAVVAAAVLPTKASARPTDFFPEIAEVAGPYVAADFAYNPPDGSDFYNLQERVLLMNDLQNRMELLKALLAYSDEYKRLNAASVMALYEYYCAPEAQEKQYLAWQKLLEDVNRDYLATWQELAASDNRPMLDALFSPEFMAQYDYAKADYNRQAELERHLKKMDEAYWQATDRDYRVNYQGREYGFEDVFSIEDTETRLAVYKELTVLRNREIAGLLADFIPVANACAQDLGYRNYAEFAYDKVYSRDYSPEAAGKLYSLVKKYVVPLYREVLVARSNNADFDFAELAAAGNMSTAEITEAIGRVMPEVSDEYAEMFDYMLDHGLADLEYDENKRATSFTAYSPYYNIARMFIGTHTETNHDLVTVVHEFGHFAFYMFMQQDVGYDVGEFYSQALELLFYNFADDIFGEAGDEYLLEEFSRMLQAIIDGCLFDEFQQRAYEMKNPTVADLNKLYRELAPDYAYAFIYTDDDEAYDWVLTEHTFVQPFYYISYAVSGLSACELLAESGEDFTAAADRYLYLAAHPDVYYADFVKNNGLADIFTEQGMRQITDGLRTYFYEEICGMADLDEAAAHWAQEPLLAAVRLGLLSGDEQGYLLPDDEITRAEVFTLLWRLCGREQAAPGSFPDVAAGAWYAGPAAWAQGAGLTKGTDGGRFAAEQIMPREELVTLIYRLHTQENDDLAVDTAVLNSFADAAEIAPWARQAFAWAVGNGIVLGDEQGLLNPGQAATRAEAAALLLQ